MHIQSTSTLGNFERQSNQLFDAFLIMVIIILLHNTYTIAKMSSLGIQFDGIDIIIDYTRTHGLLSFMDVYSFQFKCIIQLREKIMTKKFF